MKKYFLLSCLIISCKLVFSQTEILLIDEWIERCKGLDFCQLNEYLIYGDTTINSIKYRKIHSGELYGNKKVKGAIRETEDSLVYYYDMYYEREFLLYDFAWEIGKEIKSVDLGSWDEKSNVIPEYRYATITKIDTLIGANGAKLAYITTSLGTKCIQGIGDTEGFTEHLNLVRPTNGGINKLWYAGNSLANAYGYEFYLDKCCKSSDSCEEEADCEDDYVAITDIVNQQIEISPNPVKDKLTLTLPTTNNEIKIFDMQGKLVLQTECGETANINVSMLPKGVYTLVVNGAESQKFVKE